MNDESLIDGVSIEDAKIAYRNCDYEKASIIFSKFAEKNNAEALFFLGNMQNDGQGLPINTEDAKKLLTKSAELGYLPAVYRLRQIDNTNVHFYWNDNKDKKEISNNNPKYIESLEMQARQGDISSMYEYGNTLLKSNSKQDKNNGAFWLGRAAQHGHTIAQYELGLLYLEGQAVHQDNLQAMIWIKRASEYGEIKAIFKLAEMYCDESYGFLNPTQGISLLEKIKIQYPEAFMSLGRVYREGKIVEPNLELAKNNFINAIKYNVVHAYVELAKIYQAENRLGDAVELLSKAAEKNDLEGIFLLAELYEKGIGVAMLVDKASFLYNKAAEIGHTESQYRFACICRKQGTTEGINLAKKWFEKAAKNGHAVSLFEYGNILLSETDLLIQQNYTDEKQEHKVTWFNTDFDSPYYDNYHEAFEYIYKSAQQGYNPAENLLSQMYEKGIGIKANTEKAIKWCKIAAFHGNNDAQLHMAQMYDKGELIEEDLVQAFEWYKSSSQSGNPEAIYSLGKMYMDGRGVLKNDEEAFKLFVKAKDLDYLKAIYQLGVCYLKGIGCEINYKLAENFLRIAANRGYSKAVFDLAEFYILSNKVEHNFEKAIFLLNNEIDLGNDGAMLLLGKLYLTGNCVPRDNAKAIILFEQSAKLGNEQSLYELGMIYYEGQVKTKDYKKAVEYFREAADKNYAPAQYMYGQCLRDGRGILQDYKKAYQYFIKAAEKGYLSAYLSLGKMYEEGLGVICNYDEAILYYRRLANSDFKEAYDLIANIYLQGNSERGIDYKTAAIWLEQGANKHVSSCCFKLGLLHIDNKIPNSSMARGFELINEAASLDEPEAQFFLAKEYLKGNRLPLNPKKSIQLLLNASKKNHIESTTMLGMMYINGEYCERKPVVAADLFTSAAQQGNYIAQYELAKLFRNGEGVPQSLMDSYMWSVIAVASADYFPDAQLLRDEMVLLLTSSQIAEAQYMASDFLNKISNQ